MKTALPFLRIAVLLSWIWGIASFVVPERVPAPEIGRYVCMGLLLIHVGEVFAFAKGLAAKRGTLLSHVGPLLVFGYIHVLGEQHADA